MNGAGPNPLWSFEEVALALASWQSGKVVIAALAPPSAVRFERILECAKPTTPCKWLQLTPDWLLDILTTDEFPDTYAAVIEERDDLFEHVAPLFVGPGNHDLVYRFQPLSRLSLGLGVENTIRVRNLDDLGGQRKNCDILMVGGGSRGLRILRGAQALVSKHKPIIILDTLDLSGSERSDPTAYLGDLERMFSDYAALSPNRHCDQACSRRFLILHHRSAFPSYDASCVGDFSVAASYRARDIRIVANGRRRLPSHPVRWNGRSPGITFIVERPAHAGHIDILLTGGTPHGLRVMVDGEPRPYLATDDKRICEAAENADFTIRLALDDAPSEDRLIKILLAPIRPSTTTRPFLLALRGANFV